MGTSQPGTEMWKVARKKGQIQHQSPLRIQWILVRYDTDFELSQLHCPLNHKCVTTLTERILSYFKLIITALFPTSAISHMGTRNKAPMIRNRKIHITALQYTYGLCREEKHISNTYPKCTEIYKVLKWLWQRYAWIRHGLDIFHSFYHHVLSQSWIHQL